MKLKEIKIMTKGITSVAFSLTFCFSFFLTACNSNNSNADNVSSATKNTENVYSINSSSSKPLQTGTENVGGDESSEGSHDESSESSYYQSSTTTADSSMTGQDNENTKSESTNDSGSDNIKSDDKNGDIFDSEDTSSDKDEKDSVAEAKTVRFEAESADVTGTPLGGLYFVNNSQNASGGKYLGNLSSKGNTVTFIFTAEAAGTAEILFSMSSTAVDYETFLVIDYVIRKDVLAVSLNGVEIDYEPQTIKGQESDTMSGYNEVFTLVSIGEQNLKIGKNVVELAVISETALTVPNIDYMEIVSSVAVEETKK